MHNGLRTVYMRAQTNARESNPERETGDRRAEMSENGIAQQLLRGSENIDLMRKRIVQVLSMIFGLIYPVCDKKNWQPKDVAGLHIDGPGCEWVVRVGQTGRRLYVLYVCYCFEDDETMLFSTDGPFCPICTEDVQIVYESLDAFVEGMIKEFPMVLVHGLKPFTRAAEMEL